MGLSGSLRTMSAGDLIQWLSLALKTGLLVVKHAGIEKRIYFRRGRIISSGSSDPREYLGQFLISHGYINEEELKKAMEVQRQSHILLGKILVTIGVIEEPDLVRLMRLKAQEEIYAIFLWDEGEFDFDDDEQPKMQMIPLEVDVTGVILEGTRRADEWPRIREVVSSGACTPVVDKPIDLDDMEEMKKRIVQAVNGHRTIDEIVLESRSSEFHVAKTVFEMIIAKKMQLLAPKGEPEKKAITGEIFLTAEDEIAGLLKRAQKALRDLDFEKAMRALRAASSLDPENARVRSAMKGAETVIGQELRKKGLVDAQIPALKKSIEEITDMNFAPNEGFLLSRINGTWDVGSIVKVSPMREIDALLIFYQLLKRDVIELRAPEGR